MVHKDILTINRALVIHVASLATLPIQKRGVASQVALDSTAAKPPMIYT